MKSILRLILLLLLLSGVSHAQFSLGSSSAAPPSELIYVEPYFSVDPIQAGSQFQVALVVQIAEGWHINSYRPTLETLIPTKVDAQPPDGFRIGPVLYPEGELLQLEFAGDETLSVYKGEATFAFQVSLDRSVALGSYTIPVEIRYQGCSDTQCLLPASRQIDLEVNVVGLDQSVRRIHEELFAGLELEPPDAPTSSGQSNQIADWIERRGYMITFLLLFVLGLGLNLTPCVFPMIPITVSFFGGQSNGNTRRTFVLALFYVLGVSITISVLGVLAAVSGGIWGSVLQNPIVLLLVAAVLILLALSMFGVYEFRVPSFLMNQSGGSRAGVIGSLFMGLTVGVVAAPCIGSVILGLLLFVSQTATPVVGFWMFFVLAWGFGLPYLFLAVFSGGIQRLPRSGMWMLTVNKIFGFVLLGMAIYFLESLFPDALQAYILPIYIIAAGIYVGYMDRARVGPGFRRTKYLLAALAILAGVWLLKPSGHSEWPLYDEAALTQALSEGKPVLIDFYADWCFACKELVERTFSDEQVKAELRRFASFRADFTKSSEFVIALEKKYAIRGLPTVIFLNSAGEEEASLRVEQFVPADDFLQRLQQVH